MMGHRQVEQGALFYEFSLRGISPEATIKNERKMPGASQRAVEACCGQRGIAGGRLVLLPRTLLMSSSFVEGESRIRTVVFNGEQRPSGVA